MLYLRAVRRLHIVRVVWVQHSDRASNAVEGTIGEINAASSQLDPEAKGMELAKLLLGTFAGMEVDPVTKATVLVKHEAGKLF